MSAVVRPGQESELHFLHCLRRGQSLPSPIFGVAILLLLSCRPSQLFVHVVHWLQRPTVQSPEQVEMRSNAMWRSTFSDLLGKVFCCNPWTPRDEGKLFLLQCLDFEHSWYAPDPLLRKSLSSRPIQSIRPQNSSLE